MREMTKEDLLPIDVPPFTRLVWNSEGARKRYEDVLNKTASLHDKAEYEMVRQGKRKCGTLHLTPRNFHIMVERLQKDGMIWLPIQWSKNYSGFSHYHLPTTVGDSDSSCYGVMARKMDDAEAFRTASAYNGRNVGQTDHEIIGELLGFPPCCAKNFVDQWAMGFFDPVWQSAADSKSGSVMSDRIVEVEGHIHTNQMLRYFGFRTTSHFPCRLDCEASAEVGEVWLEVMQSIDPDATTWLQEILEMPLVWSCLHGIATIETPEFTCITNSLPTRERWSVLYNAPGKKKPAEVLLPLESDINHDELTQAMIKQLKYR